MKRCTKIDEEGHQIGITILNHRPDSTDAPETIG
jgi:hypothetical protein